MLLSSSPLTPSLPPHLLSDAHLRTLHCASGSSTDVTDLDPSLALGFYCRDRRDFEDLCYRLRRPGGVCSSEPDPPLGAKAPKGKAPSAGPSNKGGKAGKGLASAAVVRSDPLFSVMDRTPDYEGDTGNMDDMVGGTTDECGGEAKDEEEDYDDFVFI